MLKIFANHNTSEKVLVPCGKEQIRKVQLELEKKFGGNWVFVDKLQPGEALKFDDSQVYKGFHPDIRRYSSAIVNFDQ